MQRLEKILAQKAAPKSARITKLWQFWQGHQKVQSGTKGNFSKIPQKVAFALEADKHSRTYGIIL